LFSLHDKRKRGKNKTKNKTNLIVKHFPFFFLPNEFQFSKHFRATPKTVQKNFVIFENSFDFFGWGFNRLGQKIRANGISV
jgi:hypothetical protein